MPVQRKPACWIGFYYPAYCSSLVSTVPGRLLSLTNNKPESPILRVPSLHLLIRYPPHVVRLVTSHWLHSCGSLFSHSLRFFAGPHFAPLVVNFSDCALTYTQIYSTPPLGLVPAITAIPIQFELSLPRPASHYHLPYPSPPIS